MLEWHELVVKWNQLSPLYIFQQHFHDMLTSRTYSYIPSWCSQSQICKESIKRTCLWLPSTPGSGSATVVLTNGVLTNQGGRCLSKYCLPSWNVLLLSDANTPTSTYLMPNLLVCTHSHTHTHMHKHTHTHMYTQHIIVFQKATKVLWHMCPLSWQVMTHNCSKFEEKIYFWYIIPLVCICNRQVHGIYVV